MLLLSLLFPFFDAAVRLGQLLLEFLELTFVALFPTGGGLIPAPDPVGGQTSQRRAGMPARADTFSIQMGEAAQG